MLHNINVAIAPVAKSIHINNTPMTKNIYIPPMANNHYQINLDFDAIANANGDEQDVQKVQSRRVVTAEGILCSRHTSPSDGGNPSTPDGVGSLNQLGGWGPPGGGGGGDPNGGDDEDECCYGGEHGDGDEIGRRRRRWGG